MSWFLGHLFPSCMWLFMGLFVWIQSMHKLQWTNKFRTQPKWLAFRSIAVVLISLIGAAGEVIVPLSKGLGNYNTDHLIVWLGFGLCGLIELLHLYKVLPEPLWCMIAPISFSYIGVLFMLHDQPRYYWKLLHQTTAMLTVPLVVILVVWAVLASKNSSKAHAKGKSRDREEKSIGCCFWRGKNLEDLCGTYTDQKIYETIVPGLCAFFLLLQAMCWFEMWWEMGWYSTENLPPVVPHAEHKLLGTVIRDICFTTIILGFVSMVARQLESYYNRSSNSNASV
eukprot:TRINITY_DN12135_c0_g1_i1.p1 TRINITY_DN12135_c0_g1~~TRINITY_DN12135_c0_g1_i1.p1  ORF type:complete len:282 (-),score=40.82 TRINITY_DN12135_c0_g1_i1:73-918(-)